MSTETPAHGAPGRTNDTVLTEQRANHQHHHENTHVISMNKPANAVSIKPASTNDTTLVANITEKNGRSTGDTSNGRSDEHGREVLAELPVSTGFASSAATPISGGNMDSANKHGVMVSNNIGPNGIPQANATMIDAAITLDNAFPSHNGVDKLLVPQSTSLFAAPFDPKLPGSAAMYSASTPTIPSKFHTGAVTYGSTGNFGVAPQGVYEESVMAPPMLTANHGYQNGFHSSGGHMEVEHNAYGNLFSQSANGGVGTDFAGPSQASMSMAPHFYSGGRYGMGGATAAPAPAYTPRLNEQGVFGYPLCHMNMAQRTEVTPHTLMALDDALDRNTTTRSPRRGDEDEIVPQALATGGASGSASAVTGESSKKGSSRRKGGRGSRKADETDLRVLSKKVAPRARSVSVN